MNWRTQLPGPRVSKTHASAIIVTRPTTESGSAEADSTSPVSNSASEVSTSTVAATTKTTTTTTTTAAAAVGPSGLS